MRTIISILIVLFFITACDLPQEIQQTPSNANNTSGTLGSTPSTDKPVTTSSAQLPDTSKVKRDSLPK